MRSEQGDNVEARVLQAEKNEARSRWRMTHVALEAVARSEGERAIEAHDEHLRALQDWTAAEAAFIAERLGFAHAPLPPRGR